MKKHNKIALFEGKQIRRLLVKTDRPRKYWNDLKTKLKTEGSEVSDKIGQLKMRAADGKYYFTDGYAYFYRRIRDP